MKEIGYWREKENSNENLPWPQEGKLSDEVKQKVVDYLNKGKEYEAWLGWSNCRICGKMNGSICMTDGEFVYPEGYSHYIKDHNIMPDIGLLAKVLSE